MSVEEQACQFPTDAPSPRSLFPIPCSLFPAFCVLYLNTFTAVFLDKAADCYKIVNMNSNFGLIIFVNQAADDSVLFDIGRIAFVR